MSKLLTTLFLFVLTVSFGQEKFVFKNEFKENKTYITTSVNDMEGTIEIMGSEESMEYLRNAGMDGEMKMVQQTEAVMSMTTGSKNNDGDVPLEMVYEKMTSNGTMNGTALPVTPNPFSDLKIAGKYNAEGKMVVDSIYGGAANEQLENALMGTFEQLQSKIMFPEHELAVGDTFENEVPISIPMGNMKPMEILVKSEHTLASIDGNLAVFDVFSNIRLKSDDNTMQMSAEGEGPGKITFNIKDKYMVKYEAQVPMKLTMNLDMGMQMKMLMNTKSTVTTKIE